MTRSRQIEGLRFGRLLAIRFVARHPGASQQYRHLWAFSCACGRQVVLFKDDVVKGRVHSCGCARKGSAPGANDRAWLLGRALAPLDARERSDSRGAFVVRRHGGSAPAIPSLLALLQGVTAHHG